VSEPTASQPATGVVLVERNGLGVPTKPALDPFGFGRRQQGKHRVTGRQWFSPPAYFQGPFDDNAGLLGSNAYFQRVSINNKPPSAYLTATEAGLGIIPPQGWQMRKVRGRQDVLWVLYSDIERIELRPATRPRMSFMSPSTSSKLGEVIVTTKDKRTARLTGTTVTGLSEFLVSLGATVEL
jgi:hypothetical protein